MKTEYHQLRRNLRLLYGLTLLFIIVWQAPALYVVPGLANYLPLHNFAETFSIVVAMLVFGVAWNAYSKERPGNIIILACTLFGVALIDFAHMLSFKGMPDFVTPSSSEKAINLWLAARLFTALALFVVALRPWRPFTDPRLRYLWFAASLLISLVVIWFGVVHPEAWPDTFIAGQGLTPFKIAAEYTIVAFLLFPAVLFYQQARDQHSFDAANLFLATVVTILSELSFTLYSNVADIFNLLGHAYKIIAFYFIYRAVFVASVKEPFQRLDAESAENRRMAKELKDASYYTRSLIEASLDPLVTISAEGKITDVNMATETVTGLPREVLIGTDFSDYFTEPDKAREGYQHVFSKGVVSNYPLTLCHRGGTCVDVLYNASVYRNEDGKVQGVFAAARDITERKRAEEELRHSEHSLAEAQRMAHLGNWQLDLKTNMLKWSDETYRIFEVDPRKFKVSYETFLDVVHPEDRDRVNKAYQESLINRKPYDIEHRLLLDNGRIKYIHEKCETFYDEEGRPIRSVGMVHDVTEHVLAEKEIRILNLDLERRVMNRTIELEQVNAELESFAYSVSHDLRTPLRAISGFSHIVLEDYAQKLDAEGQRLLNLVCVNTKKMSQLIDDILAFSRSGRLEMSPAKIDMDDLVRKVLESLRPEMEGRNINLDIKPLPPAHADRAMMERVFINLFSNAIKFTRPKDPAVIETGAQEAEGETIYYVKDNGVGFDMQKADKLFGVFQRLHGDEEFEGTGIGLAIIKRIVGRHGGRVWAEGKEHEGAIFYFTLPSEIQKSSV